MAKAGQAQDEAMDEILASIRRIIEDEDVRKSGVRVAAARIAAGDAEPEAAPATGEAAPAQVSRPAESGNVVELAIAQAMEPPPDDKMPETVAVRGEVPPRRTVDMRPPPPPPARAQPLLSPRSDAAVASAFQQLTTNMLAGSARTIDELVEDMLRPMLRNWLDSNLPPLVERLVREEIERVSRGRR